MPDSTIQTVPPAQLVVRSTEGVAGALFSMLDDLMSGRPVQKDRINGAVKLTNAICNVTRVSLAQERQRAAIGPVIEAKTAE